MTTRKLLIWTLKIAVSGGITAYILTKLPLDDLAASIRSADFRYFLVAVLLLLPVMLLSAAQLGILTRRQEMAHSIPDLFRINLVTEFYRLFLPGSLATGVVRWHRLARPEKKNAQALAVVAYNRWVELAGTVILGLAFWAADPLARTNRLVPLVFAGLIACFAVLRLLLFTKAAGQFFLSVVLGRLPAEGWIGGSCKRIAKVVRACGDFEGLSRTGQIGVMGTSIARHLVGVVSIVLLARSLGLDLSVANVGWVRSVVLLVLFLPISISGFGVREGSFLILLEPYGVANADAVALSLLLFARNLFTPILGGFLEARNLFRSGDGTRAREVPGEEESPAKSS
jgi:uncharacterized membrane protein YbhN (UPF0104 family)